MKTQLINAGITEEKANELINELSKVPMEGNLWANHGKVRVYFERAGNKGYVDLVTGTYYADRDKVYNWKFMHDLMNKTNFSA